MKNSLSKRILLGLSAGAFGQLVNILIQVISVPLFLKFWGVQLYGEWLILSAIPAYLALSDVGFGAVAGNQMTMLVAQGKKQAALAVFQSCWILVSIISLAIAVLLIGGLWLLPVSEWLNFKHLDSIQTTAIFLLLAMHVLVGLQDSLLTAGFVCDGNYALSTLYSNLTRLIEFAVMLLVISIGAPPLHAAATFLAMRVVGTIAKRLALRKTSPWIVYGVRHAAITTVQRLASPALAFMGFPLGNALSLQGMVLVVGSTLGPSAVVLFSTIRTLSRFGLQTMAIVNSTVWPEISTAFGSGNMDLARKLHRHSCQASLWLSIVAVIGLFISGEWIIHVWTRGEVIVDSSLLNLMLLVIIANSFWFTSSVVPVATNNHQRMALYYVIGTSISLLIASNLLPKLGVIAAPLSLLAVDLVMSVFVIKKSLSLVKDQFRYFISTVIRPPAIHKIQNIKLLLRG